MRVQKGTLKEEIKSIMLYNNKKNASKRTTVGGAIINQPDYVKSFDGATNNVAQVGAQSDTSNSMQDGTQPAPFGTKNRKTPGY